MSIVRKVLAAMVIALAASVLPTGAAGADPVSSEAEFVARINELRASRGLPALVADGRLVDLARDWSGQMAAAGSISHRPNLASFGPAGWRKLGENVGVGGSVSRLHDAFVASPGHLANLVDPAFTHVGIGVVEAGNVLYVTENFAAFAPGYVAAPVSSPRVTASAAPSGEAPTQGYWLLGRDGGVFSFGTAGFFGSTGDIRLNRPVVSIAPTPSGRGYWFVASDGGIFAFGDAGFFGSTGDIALNSPIVGMAPTRSGQGYWLVAADGGVFAFGDAGFVGSTGGAAASPIAGMSPMPGGNGYWLVARDGTVHAFGDAPFHGSAGAGSAAVAASPSGNGYWVLSANGAVSAFGDAGFFGGANDRVLPAPAVGLSATPSGGGYRVTTADGLVFNFGDARHYGDLGGSRLSAPVVASASA